MANGNPEEPRLLSGGNPQIAKGDGQAPVSAYIAAMPGWKSAVGNRIDQSISAAVPEVVKAVRWNSPFYGTSHLGWFVSFHCFTRNIKVTFFNGAALDPLPPVEAKDPKTRYLHLFENEPFDQEQFRDWIEQASRLPGWQTKC